MAMDPSLTWATNIVNAIKALNTPDNQVIGDDHLIQVWKCATDEIIAQLAKASVAPGTFNTIDINTTTPEPVIGVGGPVT